MRTTPVRADQGEGTVRREVEEERDRVRQFDRQFAGLAWRDGYWTFPGRVHYTLVTAVAVAFVVQLGYWEFLPV